MNATFPVSMLILVIVYDLGSYSLRVTRVTDLNS